jgi:hypothetical protein
LCAWISLLLQSEHLRCQYSSFSVVAAFTGLRLEFLKFVRLALKVVAQDDGDFMDVILLYSWLISVSSLVDWFGVSNVEPVVTISVLQ